MRSPSGAARWSRYRKPTERIRSMPDAHYCTRCRRATGVNTDLGRFDVRIGSTPGLYSVCYDCWLTEPRATATAILRVALQVGRITERDARQAYANLDR